MHIKCLIVDDEPPAREVLKRYVSELPMLHLVGECGNAVQAIAALQKGDVDLMFLDIRMPQVNGTDLVKALQHQPKIIFTTAYTEYALEGYELNVVDYLIKPIKFERFLKAVTKAFPRPEGAPMPETSPVVAPELSTAFVYFRTNRKMVKVLLNDILYVEGMRDYVKVVTTGGTIVTKQPISAVEAMLPKDRFMRVHRSFITSLEKIKSFTHELLEIGGTEVPIGKLYRQELMHRLA